MTSLTLPTLFQDDMVLQAGRPVHLRGRGLPGAAVRARLAGATAEGVVDPAGAWELRLVPPAPGTGYTLEVTSAGEHRRCVGVAVGEVWLLAGQSNMEWTSRQFADAREDAKSIDLPEVRVFTVAKCRADSPEPEVGGHWQRAEPEALQDFSAVGTYLAQFLYEALRMPIGLVCSSLGDTCAEMWTSRPALESHPDFAALVTEYDAAQQALDAEADRLEPEELARRRQESRRYAPTLLFNGMVAPLREFGFRGVMWYQGESNGRRAQAYRELFPLMIRDWRRLFRDDALPFLYVQLPRFRAPLVLEEPSAWAELREAQELALALPGTAMVTAIDQGDAEDIHPPGKREIARRLAHCALRQVYGREVAYEGPRLVAIRREPGTGRLLLEYDHHGRGLELRGDNGFSLLDDAGTLVAAASALAGDGTVALTPPPGFAASTVRYAWADNPPVTLFDGEGWPAAPFRRGV